MYWIDLRLKAFCVFICENKNRNNNKMEQIKIKAKKKFKENKSKLVRYYVK